VVYLRGLDRVRLIGHRAPPNEVDVSPKNLLFLINKELHDPRGEKSETRTLLIKVSQIHSVALFRLVKDETFPQTLSDSRPTIWKIIFFLFKVAGMWGLRQCYPLITPNKIQDV
jgi:hypothetical protein